MQNSEPSIHIYSCLVTQLSMADPYNLARFLNVQDIVYDRVISELQSGRKLGHWMWYIFPQLRGLGESERSRKFAISTLGEAAAYLEHPILGLRLKDCTKLILEAEGKGVAEIFGSIDALKFRSCMTLFSQVSKMDDVFRVALAKYYDGLPDQLTLDLLGKK